MTTPTGAFEQAYSAIVSTMARYARAVDEGRPDAIVACFCVDGWVRLPFRDAVHGHEAMRAAFTRMEGAEAARHVIVNERVFDLAGDTALATSDLAVLGRTEAGWEVSTIGRYYDTFHRTESGWLVHGRILERVE